MSANFYLKKQYFHRDLAVIASTPAGTRSEKRPAGFEARFDLWVLVKVKLTFSCMVIMGLIFYFDSISGVLLPSAAGRRLCLLSKSLETQSFEDKHLEQKPRLIYQIVNLAFIMGFK